jgi:hypothetical protein
MVKVLTGDILNYKAQTFVNTINCVGINDSYILGGGSGKTQDTVLEIGERAEIPDSVWKIRDCVS